MRLSQDIGMTPEELQAILEAPIPFAEGQANLAELLVQSLTPEQTELATQSSYAYWLATFSAHHPNPTDADRRRMALREARRYLSYDSDAETFLKQACDFRKERRIDLVRACFTEGVEFDSEEDSSESERIRGTVMEEMKKQHAIVRRTDKDGRALLVIRSRTQSVLAGDDFILTQIYNVERAIAISEYDSKGLQERFSVILDFETFNRSVAPAVGDVRELVSILESKYSDRLKILIVTDPPFWMRSLWGLLKPFVHPDTREKLSMVNGEKEKAHVISEIVNEDEDMPSMLSNKKLLSDACIESYAKQVPFFFSYDAMVLQRHPERPKQEVTIHVEQISPSRIVGTF